MCFGEFIAKFGADFIISLADVTIASGEALQVGNCLNIPYDNVAHAANLQ
jgi:hypothetical protein